MDARQDLDAGAFFDEFHGQVYRFISAATGAPASELDDLVQETLIEAWRNRAQFRGEAALLTWVLSIAKNRARMRLRSLASRAALEAALKTMDREEIPADVLRGEESARAVRSALDSLDAGHAEVLLKHYYEGLPVRRIAEELGESEKAVESRLHRARQALKERLSEGTDHDD